MVLQHSRHYAIVDKKVHLLETLDTDKDEDLIDEKGSGSNKGEVQPVDTAKEIRDAVWSLKTMVKKAQKQDQGGISW